MNRSNTPRIPLQARQLPPRGLSGPGRSFVGRGPPPSALPMRGNGPRGGPIVRGGARPMLMSRGPLPGRHSGPPPMMQHGGRALQMSSARIGLGPPPPPPPPPFGGRFLVDRMQHPQSAPFVPGRGFPPGRLPPPPMPQNNLPTLPPHNIPHGRPIPPPPPPPRPQPQPVHTHLPQVAASWSASSTNLASKRPQGAAPTYSVPSNTTAKPFGTPAVQSSAVAVAPGAPKPSEPTTIPTAEQINQAWTEHTAPNGMKYYYNSLTAKSDYLKPEALKKRDASKLDSKWKEYTDSSSGRKYYSDGVTTTWEKPSELKVTSVGTLDKDDDDEISPKKKKKRKETEFGSKEEAIAAFKGLLLAKDISPTLKWHEVAKLCGSDSRWEACEDVLTPGERKQALAEYQTKRANELRTVERQERARAKDIFNQLLKSVLPTAKGFSPWNSKFEDVREFLAKDDRFHAVAEEGTRESLFLDFCEEYRKLGERKRKSKRRDSHEAFLAFLDEKAEDGVLSFASTWETFLGKLSEQDRADTRFVVSLERSDEDRQLYFADFVIELQAREDDKRRRIRDARQRAEQEQREAFLARLANLAAAGKLLPASRWRHVEELVVSDPTFAPVAAQDREGPREIFEEFADKWNLEYRRDRTFLSQLVYPAATTDALVKADTSFDEFSKALLERASETPEKYATTRAIINKRDPVSSAQLYYNELSMRARGVSGPAFIRRGSSLRRKDSESSEDEGEIVEEGELLAAELDV